MLPHPSPLSQSEFLSRVCDQEKEEEKEEKEPRRKKRMKPNEKDEGFLPFFSYIVRNC